MPTVLRLAGLRFMIFTDDHPPPHVHVFGEGEAKIAIGTGGAAPAMIYARGMNAANQRQAMAAVTASQAMFLRKWIDIHGGLD